MSSFGEDPTGTVVAHLSAVFCDPKSAGSRSMFVGGGRRLDRWCFCYDGPVSAMIWSL